jgi:hypothetical protein
MTKHNVPRRGGDQLESEQQTSFSGSPVKNTGTLHDNTHGSTARRGGSKPRTLDNSAGSFSVAEDRAARIKVRDAGPATLPGQVTGKG